MRGEHEESTARTCPLCGRPNGCVVAAGGEGARCWCSEIEVRPESLAALPPGADPACLCADCARGDYPSPCQLVCVLDAARGRCNTCLRTKDEIAGWATRSREDKLRVLAALARRRIGLAEGGDAEDGADA